MLRSFLLLSLLISLPLSAQTRKHPAKPVGIVSPAPAVRADLPAASVKIDGLRAVMLGGNVDGPNGASTLSYRNYLKRVAAVLRDRGVKVDEVYSPTSSEKIRSTVKGAHFIFYAGHGIGSSDPPSYNGNITPAGMLVVDEVWTGEKDVNTWEPAPGAIVFYLGACFTAGNSGDDIGKIKDAEAKRRISVYSAPFFKKKFGGYYAAWSDSQAQSVMSQLFAGKTLGEAYALSGGEKDVFKSAHPLVAGNDLWYHRSNRGGGYAFDFSFVGKPASTLAGLFKSNTDTNPTTNTDINPNKPDANIEPTPPDVEPTQPQISAERAREYGMLMIAAIYDGKDQEALSYLKSGADTSVRHSGWTPLMLATYYERPVVVQALIKYKADLNANLDGWTALGLANAYDKTAIAQMLKVAGARTDRALPGNKPGVPAKPR
ncbi:MAG: ankyrin repeat domain-containing protein [Spirochaetia bacterium]|nr:ankyrin repeat domain-containing protein [Spirochaetia bacterium]